MTPPNILFIVSDGHTTTGHHRLGSFAGRRKGG